MEITMLDKDKKSGRVSFVLKKSTPAYANALRRVMMEEVPTLAIEHVEFQKNSSVVYDELVAHRLGLVPLTTDLETYEYVGEDGVLNAKNSLKLSCEAKGPGYVYSSELKTKDPKVKPTLDKLPITKLLKGQELAFEATAVLGCGKTHAKWAPCHVWYRYEADIKINNSSKQFDQFKEMYPSAIFGKDGKIDKKLILENDLVDACDGVCDDIVSVTYKNDTFVFFVEPFGQLEVKEIVKQAAEILEKKMGTFAKMVSELK